MDFSFLTQTDEEEEKEESVPHWRIVWIVCTVILWSDG
jgi:hypothetical protein